MIDCWIHVDFSGIVSVHFELVVGRDKTLEE